MTTTTTAWTVPADAAEALTALLAAIPATGTDQDRRVRRAIHAAASALERHQDPREAIQSAYRPQ